MEKRTRMTARDKQAVEDNIPYPGTVNQEDREFKKVDQYHNYEPTPGHWTPIKEKIVDERNSIGFGIPREELPKTASEVITAANKAVKLAVLLLGDKVAQEHIEEQAKHFLAMSNASLDSTLKLYSETQHLYAEEVVADGTPDAPVYDTTNAEFGKGDGPESKEEALVAEEVVAEEVVAEEAPVVAETVETPVVAEEAPVVAEEVIAEEAPVVAEEAPVVAEEAKEEEVVEEAKEASEGFDIELTVADDHDCTAEDMDIFEGIVSDPYTASEEGTSITASKKEGATSLGGQPKTASADESGDVWGGLWKDAVDVNDVFHN